MSAGVRLDRRLRLVAEMAALAGAYVLAARLGLMMDAVAGFATLVWAPTGIALAALVVAGRRLWPGVFLGAFVVNVWVGAPALVALGIAAGNTLEAVLGATALQRMGVAPQLERVRDVVGVMLFGAIASTVASATLGVASLWAGGLVPGSGLAATWRAWWVGDAMGDVVVAPLLLVWSRAPRWRPTRGAVVEGTATVGAALAASYAVFGGGFSLDAYALFGPLVWSAVRLRQRGATLVVAIVSACAVAGTALHHGPFARAHLSAGLLELQSFMGFVAAVTLLLCAAVAERDQARAQALEALKGRDDFLAIASHELRTPMSALLLKLGSMRHRLAKGGAVSAEAVSQAEGQTERLAHLVNRLLDVSRVEAGQLQVSRGPMDLADLVRGVTQRLDEEARRAGCALRVSAPPSVRGAWDRLRIEQIVLNLLSNAFRHAPGEPVDVSLTVEADMAQLTVRDHGAGMAEDQVEAMFARYSRGESARERGGLGLGLYISRRLVEAHGGTLRAKGNPGAGCAFIVELPLEGGLS